MSEKVIKFPGKKIERPEDIFKVGVHVNLKGNLRENYDKGSIFYYEIKSDLLLNNYKNINKEKIFNEAFGISWEITSVDFVDDMIKIQTKMYGLDLEMMVSPYILRVANGIANKKE